MFKKSNYEVSEELEDFFDDQANNNKRLKLLIKFGALDLTYTKPVFTITKEEKKQQAKVINHTKETLKNSKKSLF